MKGMRTLSREGYTTQQRKEFIARLWLKWIPRKVSAMIWLTTAGGLPIGEWRAKAGWEGTCQTCKEPGIETTKHALMTCNVAREA